MNFAEWWNPGARAEAELDSSIAEILWSDAEKRRKNAWLRKVGFVTRIFVYLCIFGLLLFFTPESLRDGWIFSRPFAALTLGDVLGALVWTLIAVRLGYALFHPNPRPDFRENYGWLGVVMIGLTVTALLAFAGIGAYLGKVG
jgi:hypothetical protein